MKAIERLRRDHQLLRTKLDVLEGVLRMDPASTWFILRELSFTLSRQLQDHIRREEALIRACRKTAGPQAVERNAIEHRDEAELLRTINRLFTEEEGRARERVRTVLGQAIKGLRDHMAEEEAELFPAIESLLGDTKLNGKTPAKPPLIKEDMTVNVVTSRFPATQAVFTRLFVSPLYESCDCLDEVAWRHGMTWRDLTDRLEQAIAEPTLLEAEAKPPQPPRRAPEEAGAAS